MSGWKMLLVQLLVLTWHLSSEVVGENLVKTPGREPHVAPICSNSTEDIITLIVCKINTSYRRDCRLLYRLEHGFEQDCDPNIRLVKKNQTVFLDLTSLTPRDSGSYNCECSSPYKTKLLHFNITIEGDEATTSPSGNFPIYLTTGVILLIFITVVILIYIHRKIHHCSRRELEQPPSPPVTEYVEDIEPYSTFIQRENGLYSLAVFPNRETSPPRVTHI